MQFALVITLVNCNRNRVVDLFLFFLTFDKFERKGLMSARSRTNSPSNMNVRDSVLPYADVIDTSIRVAFKRLLEIQ